jgi:hypothetical protein
MGAYANDVDTTMSPSVENSTRGFPIRPNIGRVDFDSTELERFRRTRPRRSLFPAQRRTAGC